MADGFLVGLGLAEPHCDVAVHREGRAVEVLDEQGREFLPPPPVARVDGLDQRCVAQPVQAGRARHHQPVAVFVVGGVCQLSGRMAVDGATHGAGAGQQRAKGGAGG